jgi:hypothetical protein
MDGGRGRVLLWFSLAFIALIVGCLLFNSFG